MEIKNKRRSKCYGLLLACSIICGLLSVVFSGDANAVTEHYSNANVDFYSDSQHQATVNLPWSANPGTNKFWLNNIYVDNSTYNNKKLSYFTGRGVLELRNIGVLPNGNIVSSDIFLCGLNSNQLMYSFDNSRTGKCVGDLTVVYTDQTNTKLSNQLTYITWNSATRTAIIYFDYSILLESNKTISFIQYRFHTSENGYDILSRTSNWVDVNLFSLFDVRSSITAYETPPDNTDFTNDLLQQQIAQNQTQIDRELEAEDNISGQSASDIQGATNQQTSNIISVISSFVTAISSVQSGNCSLELPFPSYAGGTITANPCNFKEKAPQIVTIGSSLLLICVFVPLAYIVLKMIYNEIRSWTNG